MFQACEGCRQERWFSLMPAQEDVDVGGVLGVCIDASKHPLWLRAVRMLGEEYACAKLAQAVERALDTTGDMLYSDSEDSGRGVGGSDSDAACNQSIAKSDTESCSRSTDDSRDEFDSEVPYGIQAHQPASNEV